MCTTIQSTLEAVEAAKSREQAEKDKKKPDPEDAKRKLERLIKDNNGGDAAGETHETTN